MANFRHVGAGGITPANLTPSGESTWVGVGGGIAGETQGIGLIQYGTSMITGQSYQDWWEYLGTSGCVSLQFRNRVKQNDSIAASADWTSRTSACFSVTDFTTTSASLQ